MLKIKCRICKNGSVGNVGKKNAPFWKKVTFFSKKMLKTPLFVIDKIYTTPNI